MKALTSSTKHNVSQRATSTGSMHKNGEVWPCVLADRTIGRADSCLWHDVSSVVCDVLYCGETVRPSGKVSEGVNREPGLKSSFFGSPPYFYLRFRRYGHRDGHFCRIFARTAKQSVLDGRSWLSSSKPFVDCVVRIETGSSFSHDYWPRNVYVLAKSCQTAQCYYAYPLRRSIHLNEL